MSKLAFVFPGQGAQAPGMGRDLYENSVWVRKTFDTINRALGFSISDLCFNGSEADLKETRITQPALYAVSMAAWSACLQAGLKADATAGHSIGEYAALCVAGAFDMQTGARLVKARGEAMAEAATERAGAMAAVLGLDPNVVWAACQSVNNIGVVVPANLNAPGQVVISGEAAAVEAVSVVLKEQGAKRVLPLAVSGAFHSPLMDKASAVMQGVLELTEINDPELPIVANVTADYERTAAEVKANLAHQVAGPVRWTETIQRLVGDGYTTFIECGPGTVLAGLIKRIAPEAKTYSVSDMASLAVAKEALLG